MWLLVNSECFSSEIKVYLKRLEKSAESDKEVKIKVKCANLFEVKLQN